MYIWVPWFTPLGILLHCQPYFYHARDRADGAGDSNRIISGSSPRPRAASSTLAAGYR